MTDDRRKSDIAVVPEKSRNAVDASTGDATEGRAVAKGNSPERNVLRTQGRASTPSALEGYGKPRNETRNSGSPRSCTAYLALTREAAAGVDGETWHSYGQTLEANLQDLSDRVHRWFYRAIGPEPHPIFIEVFPQAPLR